MHSLSVLNALTDYERSVSEQVASFAWQIRKQLQHWTPVWGMLKPVWQISLMFDFDTDCWVKTSLLHWQRRPLRSTTTSYVWCLEVSKVDNNTVRSSENSQGKQNNWDHLLFSSSSLCHNARKRKVDCCHLPAGSISDQRLQPGPSVASRIVPFIQGERQP